MVSTVNTGHYAKRKEKGQLSFREERSKIYNLQTKLSLLAVDCQTEQTLFEVTSKAKIIILTLA